MKKQFLSLLAAALMLTACSNPPAPTEAPATVPVETAPQVQFTETVLVDDENCTFKITAIEEDNLFGYTLKVALENKTDMELMFSLEGVSVNGFMCDPFWAEEIAPGKRSNTEISWSSSDFEDNGITDVESITLPIRVYDADDWMADDFVSETFTLNP